MFYLHGTELKRGSVMKYFEPHHKVMLIVSFVLCFCVGLNTSALPEHLSTVFVTACMSFPDPHQ